MSLFLACLLSWITGFVCCALFATAIEARRSQKRKTPSGRAWLVKADGIWYWFVISLFFASFCLLLFLTIWDAMQ